MGTILQKHLAQKFSTQLNLRKSLMETEGTCCGISQQCFVVHIVARPNKKLNIIDYELNDCEFFHTKLPENWNQIVEGKYNRSKPGAP
jgi:hypothetical protein